jgi:DNA polymerase-3 subunit delta'
MAEPEQEDQAPPPLPGPLLERARAAWLAPLCERLQRMHAQGRMPHGLLLVGPPGGGQREIGVWLAAMLACRAAEARCGQCADCRLFDAGNHPDFHWLRVAPDKKEISIGQVRELLTEFALKSYRGGTKAALIEPAESMNIHSFNALLKTLEEPARDTYLVLATSRADRIPRTIASRCMRLRVPLPARPDGLAWLNARVPGPWEGLLEGTAPNREPGSWTRRAPGPRIPRRRACNGWRPGWPRNCGPRLWRVTWLTIIDYHGCGARVVTGRYGRVICCWTSCARRAAWRGAV